MSYYDFLKDIMNGRFSSADLKGTSKQESFPRPPPGPKDLGPIIKSPLDSKNYKAIQLPNGLRALLVSTCLHELESGMKPSSNDASLNQKIAEFNSTHLGLDSFEDLQNPSPLQNKNPTSKKPASTSKTKPKRKLNAENDDEVEEMDVDPPIQNPNQTDGRSPPAPHPPKKPKVIGCCKGPATICVAIEGGSFHDHPEVYGLAHFVEHLIFLGSKRYPEPNTLFSRVYESGGSVNATTFAEHTIFFYSSSSEAFEPLLDILVDAIVNTSLTEDMVMKEINAIDSEYGIKQTCDVTRLNDFIRSRAKARHPMRKFYWGDKKSLSHPRILDIVREWKSQYYVANNMTVCIQGPYAIDKLEEMMVKYFALIPSSPQGHPPPSIELQKYGHPFNEENFYTKYYIAPLTNLTCIFMTWFLDPKFWLDYETHPLHYIRQMLNSKAPGGLLQYLKGQGWISEAFNVEVSCHCTDNFCRNSFGSIFSITFYVTELGYEYREEVVEAVFSYLNMLKGVEQEQSKRLFQEMQWTRAMAFHFQNWDELAQSGISTALTLQHVHPKYVLLHHFSLSLKYDKEKIRDCLNELSPRLVNILFVSGENQEFCRDKAWACNIRYYKEHISPRRYHGLENISVLQEFQMPPFGTFIAKPIILGEEIIPCEHGADGNQEIYRSQSLRVNYQSEKRVPCFGSRVPSASYTVSFASPHVASQTRIKSGVLDIWTSIARDLAVFSMAHKFGSFFSDFDMFSTDADGVSVDLTGPSCYLPAALEHIASAMFVQRGMPDGEQMFLNLKADSLRHLTNLTFDTDILCKDIWEYLIYSDHLCLFQVRDDVADLTYDKFLELLNVFRERMFISVYISGAVSQADVEAIINLLEEVPASVPFDIPILSGRSTIIPDGFSRLVVQGLHPGYVTSAVMNYYQVGRRTDKHARFTAIVYRLLKRTLPNQLRTMEQLGYTVYPTRFNDCGSLGLVVTVLTHPNRCKTDYVDVRIDSVLENYYHKVLKNQQELERLLSKICKEKKEEMEEIREFFKDHFLETGQNYKKLSIQVKGYYPGMPIPKLKRQELRGERQGNGQDPHEIVTLQYLTSDPPIGLKTKFRAISDIKDFKKGMSLYGLDV